MHYSTALPQHSLIQGIHGYHEYLGTYKTDRETLNLFLNLLQQHHLCPLIFKKAFPISMVSGIRGGGGGDQNLSRYQGMPML